MIDIRENLRMASSRDARRRAINEQGGINGRNIKFISYDDAYSPPRTVEQALRRAAWQVKRS
jgi:branched-chain amino acid transport system substrate-binding protein